MCYIGGFFLRPWFCFNIFSKILAVTVFRNQLYKTSVSPWNRTLGIRFKHSTVLEWVFLNLDLFEPSYWPKNKKFYAKKQKKNHTIVMQRMKFPILSFCLCLNARFRALSGKWFSRNAHCFNVYRVKSLCHVIFLVAIYFKKYLQLLDLKKIVRNE